MIIRTLHGKKVHLQDVVFCHGGNHPVIRRIPGKVRHFGGVAAVDEQQLRWTILYIFRRLHMRTPDIEAMSSSGAGCKGGQERSRINGPFTRAKEGTAR